MDDKVQLENRKELEDELKVQLESRQDLQFLRDELRAYLDENAFTTTEQQRERFLEDVFALLAPNMQIDGIDLDKLAPESGVETVDVQLEERLESLQAETDKLLVEITGLRRKCPEEIRERFALGLEDLDRCIPGVGEALSPLEADPRLDQASVDALTHELTRLRDLNESIPLLVAKLKRAQTVLEDSAKSHHQSPSQSQEGQKLPAQLSDMLTRQRRITRQQDLAAKLLAQQ